MRRNKKIILAMGEGIENREERSLLTVLGGLGGGKNPEPRDERVLLINANPTEKSNRRNPRAWGEVRKGQRLNPLRRIQGLEGRKGGNVSFVGRAKHRTINN